MTRRKRSDKGKRICYCCDTKETYLHPDGHEQWYSNLPIGWICMNCYNRHFNNPKRTATKRMRVYNKRRLDRQIRYKDKMLYPKEKRRIGVCNWCRAIIGQINPQTDKLCKQTHMNHEEYHDDDPLKDAIELCVPCHRKYHIEEFWTKIRKQKLIGKDTGCYACGTTVIAENKDKRWIRWIFNPPTAHILCYRCYDSIRGYTRKYNRTK